MNEAINKVLLEDNYRCKYRCQCFGKEFNIISTMNYREFSETIFNLLNSGWILPKGLEDFRIIECIECDMWQRLDDKNTIKFDTFLEHILYL